MNSKYIKWENYYHKSGKGGGRQIFLWVAVFLQRQHKKQLGYYVKLWRMIRRIIKGGRGTGPLSGSSIFAKTKIRGVIHLIWHIYRYSNDPPQTIQKVFTCQYTYLYMTSWRLSKETQQWISPKVRVKCTLKAFLYIVTPHVSCCIAIDGREASLLYNFVLTWKVKETMSLWVKLLSILEKAKDQRGMNRRYISFTDICLRLAP